MAASKEEALRATLSGIIVDRRKSGPEITIETLNEDGTPGEPIVLHFVPKMPFKAMAGLIANGAAVGMPTYLKECLVEADQELFESLDLTWEGADQLVAKLTELYSGNSNTEPSLG